MSNNYDLVEKMLDTNRANVMNTNGTAFISAVVTNGEVTIYKFTDGNDSFSARYERDRELHFDGALMGREDGEDFSVCSIHEAQEILLASIFHHVVHDWEGKTFLLEMRTRDQHGNGFTIEILTEEGETLHTVTERGLLYDKWSEES